MEATPLPINFDPQATDAAGFVPTVATPCPSGAAPAGAAGFSGKAKGTGTICAEHPPGCCAANGASPQPENPAAPTPVDPWAEQFSESLQKQHARVREFLTAQRQRWQQAEAVLQGQIQQLGAQVQSLGAQCSQLQQELAERPQAVEPTESADDLKQRYEMALGDIRDLRARLSELQKQAERPSSPAHVPASDGALDWETEKRRILAALESDEKGDAPAPAERLKIEEIITRTDRIVAEKNREIEELRHLLDTQANSIGSVAVGAAALEQIFDQDAIIREERENLERLKQQLQEKLRQAEIDLSLERAKLARQQAEVDGKLRSMEAKSHSDETLGDALSPTGRPVRGRWLARLGLSESEPPPREK